MKLILASNNKGKLKEMRSLLADLDIEVVSQREAGCDFEVDETGATFEENAFLKAQAVTKATGYPAVADDSGLEVKALGGAPGVYSARYSGSHEHSDRQRNDYLLKKLEGVADRSAKFVSCLCCTFPSGDILRSRGECRGELLYRESGGNGFGYDPLFRPLDFDRSMGELSDAEKNVVSHRGASFRDFKEQLWKYLEKTGFSDGKETK